VSSVVNANSPSHRPPFTSRNSGYLRHVALPFPWLIPHFPVPEIAEFDRPRGTRDQSRSLPTVETVGVPLSSRRARLARRWVVASSQREEEAGPSRLRSGGARDDMSRYRAGHTGPFDKLRAGSSTAAAKPPTLRMTIQSSRPVAEIAADGRTEQFFPNR